MLKNHMDNQPNARYILSGSSVSLLHDVFLKPDSPLYLIAARIQLEPIKKKNIDVNDVKNAFSSMLNEFDSEFEARYTTKFSRQQQDILKYLSQNKTRRLSEISEDMQTPASSLTTSMRDLYNTMTVNKIKEGIYGIMDNVFRLWIKKNILGM